MLGVIAVMVVGAGTGTGASAEQQSALADAAAGKVLAAKQEMAQAERASKLSEIEAAAAAGRVTELRAALIDADAKLAEAPVLGLKLEPLSAQLAGLLGLSGGGVFVNAVDAKSEAARAGVKARDIIVRLNSVAVQTPEELSRRCADAVRQGPVNLALVRDSKPLELRLDSPLAKQLRVLAEALARAEGDAQKKQAAQHDAASARQTREAAMREAEKAAATLLAAQAVAREEHLAVQLKAAEQTQTATRLHGEEAEAEALVAEQQAHVADEALRKPLELGATLEPVSPQVAAAIGLAAGKGVFVATLEAGAAAKSGVQVHDVIMRVNNKPVDSPAALAEILDRAGASDALQVQVLRAKHNRTVTLSRAPSKALAQQAEQARVKATSKRKTAELLKAQLDSASKTVAELSLQIKQSRDLRAALQKSDSEAAKPAAPASDLVAIPSPAARTASAAAPQPAPALDKTAAAPAPATAKATPTAAPTPAAKATAQAAPPTPASPAAAPASTNSTTLVLAAPTTGAANAAGNGTATVTTTATATSRPVNVEVGYLFAPTLLVRPGVVHGVRARVALPLANGFAVLAYGDASQTMYRDPGAVGQQVASLGVGARAAARASERVEAVLEAGGGAALIRMTGRGAGADTSVPSGRASVGARVRVADALTLEVAGGGSAYWLTVENVNTLRARPELTVSLAW